jgi:hypothetical protein
LRLCLLRGLRSWEIPIPKGPSTDSKRVQKQGQTLTDENACERRGFTLLEDCPFNLGMCIEKREQNDGTDQWHCSCLH